MHLQETMDVTHVDDFLNCENIIQVNCILGTYKLQSNTGHSYDIHISVT